MAIATGNTITAADMYGGGPGWTSGVGQLGGSVSCWRYGNLFLFSFAVCNSQNHNASPCYYKPNGWDSNSTWIYASCTNINAGTPTTHFCNSSGLGFSVSLNADNVWHVGNVADRYK